MQQRRQEFSMGRGVDTLSRILTSMLSLMTRLRKADIHTVVSEERKLYHNSSMSPIPQKLSANYTVVHVASRSYLTYTVAHPGFGKGRCTTGNL